MRMKRFYERLRYSMLGNLIVVLGLIAVFYLGHFVLFWLVANARKLKGLSGLLFLLYFAGLCLVNYLLNYFKTRRYQRAVYGIGAENEENAPAAKSLAPDARSPQPRLERRLTEKAAPRPDRYPDEKALRRMERAREKKERALKRARTKAERREQKENMRW